jgi:gamma-glutamylcyclotransferase (GGCT)/AIG2-like uncharacterized protein YtfP
MTLSRIFVYGTLRGDLSHEMSLALAQRASLLGEGTVQGQLFSLGAYPGLVLSDRLHDVVKGEVYEIAPDRIEGTLALLDEYEGLGPSEPEPHEYRREAVPVTISGAETIEAWAYVLNQPTQGLPQIPSGDFREWRDAHRVA